jgi:MFS family permease
MEGGHFSIFPAVACTIYGAQLGSKVYSLLFIGTALAAFIGMLVANLVLPMFGWGAVYLTFAVICMLSLFLLLMFEEKPITLVNEKKEKDYYMQLLEGVDHPGSSNDKPIFKSSDDSLERHPKSQR